MIQGLKHDKSGPPPITAARVPLAPATPTPVNTATESAPRPDRSMSQGKNAVSAPLPARRGAQRRGCARGSRSTPSTRRPPGISDEEISHLDSDVKKAAEVKTRGLTDEEKYEVVKYITGDKQWPDFRVAKNADFTHVCTLQFCDCLWLLMSC